MPLPDGFVLAGGRGARMGGDKALATFRGQPLWRGVALGLSTVTAVRLVRRAAQAPLSWETVVEPDAPDHHPLHGVVAALHAARGPVVVVAAVDLVLAPPELWATLVAAGPSVAVADGVVQPLVACLPATLLPRARELLAAGAPARALVDGLRRVEVPARWVADADDPAALLALAADDG